MLSLFILACLAASSASCPVRRQVPQPSSTLNNWWPFPPPATVAPQLITPAVPSPSAFSSSSSPTPTSTSMASSTPTPSPTIPTADEDDSARRQEAHKHKLHNIIYFYIIPILSFVGVICLSATCWLLYGCCTRRPRYRSASQGRPGRGHEKEWDCSGGVAGFRAFRYDDFAPPANANLNDTDTDHYTAYVQPRSCQHTREFGFECDCSHDQQRQRQSVLESELYRDWFKWPGVNEGIREEANEDEEGSTGNQSPDMSLCSRTTTPNRATPLPTPTATTTSPTNKTRSGSIGSSIKRQTRGKDECEEGFQMIVEEELERDEDEDGEEQNRPLVYSRTPVARQRGGSTHSSNRQGTMPVSHDSFVLVDERVEYKNKSRGNWFNKMVGSFSRISSSSSSEGEGGRSGKAGDRYTALPGSSEVGVDMSTKFFSPTRLRGVAPHRHRQHRLPRVSTTTLAVLSSNSNSNSNLSLDPANDNTTTDYDGDLSQEIARQRERLAKHRESIASLPAGMVYSPPLVGVCVFEGGEDGRGRVCGEMGREKRLPPRPL